MPYDHRTSRIVPAVAAAILLGVAQSPLHAQLAQSGEPAPASFVQAFTSAAQALAAENHPRLRELLLAALSHAPEQPRALYHLARAEALLGDTTAAIAALDRLAAQGAVRDIAADPAFERLRPLPAFQAALARIATAAAPLVRSDTSFIIPDADFTPEGIAYDSVGLAFYVGSLHRGTIVRVGRDGSARMLARIAPAGGQVAGLRVDTPRRRLYAATWVVDSTAPAYQRGIGAWSALHVYDLERDTLLFRAPLPNDGRPQLLNDVALSPDGDAYLSESEGGRLFRLRPGSTALELLYAGDPNFTYPNGITLSADGSLLYVAHSEGISAFRPGASTATRQPLTVAPGIPTSGFDGLYACRGSLVGIQSLLGFSRVVRLALSSDGLRVEAQQPLEQHHPSHDTPTTGVLAEDGFHYIANAQLGRLQADQSLGPTDAPTTPVVLRLPLPEGCGG